MCEYAKVLEFMSTFKSQLAYLREISYLYELMHMHKYAYMGKLHIYAKICAYLLNSHALITMDCTNIEIIYFLQSPPLNNLIPYIYYSAAQCGIKVPI